MDFSQHSRRSSHGLVREDAYEGEGAVRELPPFSFVGALGIGPKFLLDEFAMLDSRWPEKDNTVMWVCYMGFFTMVPLCYMW